MYISVQFSLSNWSFQQARRTEIPRLDQSNPQLTLELVSLFLLNLKQINCQSKRLSRNNSGPQPLVSSPPTLKQQKFQFSELHANKLIIQSLQVVDLNINRLIIGHGLIRSLGIDIHGTDMTIHWDDAAIPWRDIYSTTNYVFALSQHNKTHLSTPKQIE